MEENLNRILSVDLRMHDRVFPLLSMLRGLNKQQGLGFVVGGVVITRRTLWLVLSGLYGLSATVGPTLLGNLGLEATCTRGGAQHASCDFGWTFADDACFKLFGDGVLGQPLGWADAEEACLQMGSNTHLASVTSEEQQVAVAMWLLARVESGEVWIGLNDLAEEGSFVWSDDEPLGYSNWRRGEPNDGYDGEDAAQMNTDGTWNDRGHNAALPYICAKKATPTFASGGNMLGCTGGHWVMGTPYKQPHSLGRIAPTIVYGMYNAKVYGELAPTKVALNETITTAAECAAVVHRDYEAANAAVYSNVGREECWAVFGAAGVIYDPVLQTCMFEEAR
jgi:hypothetical protein